MSQRFARHSQLGLGYFLIHVCGQEFGVKSPKATLLACSYDEVKRRLDDAGMHVAPFSDAAVKEIMEAYLTVIYGREEEQPTYFGMRASQFQSSLQTSRIVWAPDGDAAFDDGSHVLQFDQGNRVRLIAFKNQPKVDDRLASLAEAIVDRTAYYAVLKTWSAQFILEWMSREHLH